MISVTAAHAAVLAAIHEAAFPPGERWDAQAFAGMLQSAGTFGFLDERGGFVLARQAGGEGEVLTLAVAPGVRQLGIGRGLVGAAVAMVSGPMFLEVAADNQAALALYGSAGFAECGRRLGYYGAGRDALVLRAGCAAAFAGGTARVTC